MVTSGEALGRSETPLARSRLLRGAAAIGAAAFVAVGLLGAFRYVSNFWFYRGFPPPKMLFKSAACS